MNQSNPCTWWRICHGRAPAGHSECRKCFVTKVEFAECLARRAHVEMLVSRKLYRIGGTTVERVNLATAEARARKRTHALAVTELGTY